MGKAGCLRLLGALQQHAPDSRRTSGNYPHCARDRVRTAGALGRRRRDRTFCQSSDRAAGDPARYCARGPAYDAAQSAMRLPDRLCGPQSAGVGTGFLVGPDLVLTNWHVVKRLQEAPAVDKPGIAKELRFRFDLLERADAVEARGGPPARSSIMVRPLLRASPAAGNGLQGWRRRARHGRARLCSHQTC